MQHPFYPFVRSVFHPHDPYRQIGARYPPVDKRIVIWTAGISALAAGINAIGLGLVRQLYDHPPAGAMELFCCIDTIGAATDHQMGTTQRRQTQQVPRPGILEFGPPKLARLPRLGEVRDGLSECFGYDLTKGLLHI